MLDKRKGRFGLANGSARKVRPWSLVEELIHWFADQAGADDDMRDSPVWMHRAILEFETAGMPSDEARLYKAARADRVGSLTGNWRAKGYVPWDSWPMVQALTGLPTCVLDLAMRRKMAGDDRPFELKIPGPAKADRKRGMCVAA